MGNIKKSQIKVLTMEGVKRILEAIKEKYSKKEHTHKVNDVTGLANVAVSGNYSDLNGLPTIPTIGTASTLKAGIIKPGAGMLMNGDVLNLSLGDGLAINDDGKIYNTSVCSVILTGKTWSEIYTDFIKNVVQARVRVGIIDTINVTLVNTGVTVNNIMNHTFTYNKLENINNSFNGDTLILKNEVEGFITHEKENSHDWTLDDCCETDEELLYYEVLRILMSEDNIDGFEIALYNSYGSGSVVLHTCKDMYEMVKVKDDKTRLTNISYVPHCDVNTFVCNNITNKYEPFFKSQIN